jgi:hypothetical protein
MDEESEPGWIAFLQSNTYSFYESFIEDPILDSFVHSMLREVIGNE